MKMFGRELDGSHVTAAAVGAAGLVLVGRYTGVGRKRS